MHTETAQSRVPTTRKVGEDPEKSIVAWFGGRGVVHSAIVLRRSCLQVGANRVQVGAEDGRGQHDSLTLAGVVAVDLEAALGAVRLPPRELAVEGVDHERGGREDGEQGEEQREQQARGGAYARHAGRGLDGLILGAGDAVLAVCFAGEGGVGVCVVCVALCELSRAQGRGAICVAPVQLDAAVAAGFDAAGVGALDAAHSRPGVFADNWCE